jgi:hypothetical protein
MEACSKRHAFDSRLIISVAVSIAKVMRLSGCFIAASHFCFKFGLFVSLNYVNDERGVFVTSPYEYFCLS